MIYLFLELSQLSRQVGHQPHGRLQLLLQIPDFVLLPLCVTAHQRHGTHPWKPVEVVLLWSTEYKAMVVFSFKVFYWEFPELE